MPQSGSMNLFASPIASGMARALLLSSILILFLFSVSTIVGLIIFHPKIERYHYKKRIHIDIVCGFTLTVFILAMGAFARFYRYGASFFKLKQPDPAPVDDEYIRRRGRKPVYTLEEVDLTHEWYDKWASTFNHAEPRNLGHGYASQTAHGGGQWIQPQYATTFSPLNPRSASNEPMPPLPRLVSKPTGFVVLDQSPLDMVAATAKVMERKELETTAATLHSPKMRSLTHQKAPQIPQPTAQPIRVMQAQKNLPAETTIAPIRSMSGRIITPTERKVQYVHIENIPSIKTLANRAAVYGEGMDATQLKKPKAPFMKRASCA